MKASDIFVRWAERFGYVAVFIIVVLNLHVAFEHHSLQTAKVPAGVCIAVTAMWFYALWSRERKPPRDQEDDPCDAEQP